MMKLFKRLLEMSEPVTPPGPKTITLGEVCAEDDSLYDEQEYVSNYRHLEKEEFIIHTLPHTAIKNLMTPMGDMTILAAYRSFASRDQKELVDYKTRKFDYHRIVVLDGPTVVDGNHHLVAAYKAKKDIKFIDLSEV